MFSDRYRASDYQNSWPKNYHNYRTRGQTRKTIIDHHEKFDQAPPPPRGGGGSAIYGLYSYVPLWRVWFFKTT